MAEIYAGASRVVIWLGDAAIAAAAGHDVDQVFAAIDMCSILQSIDPGQRGEFFAFCSTTKLLHRAAEVPWQYSHPLMVYSTSRLTMTACGGVFLPSALGFPMKGRKN
jgi:hypothetical protein